MKHACGPYFRLCQKDGVKDVVLTNLGLGIVQRPRPPFRVF